MFEGLKIDLQKKSLAEQVYQHVKRMILSEELRGGQKIPEERIAQTFGVSRTPIREALRKLERTGLVRIVPRSHAEVIRLDPEDALHLGEVRIELECLAARLLAVKATEEDCAVLEELDATCGECAAAGDIGGVFEADNELHLEIARRGGNPYVKDILRNLAFKIQLLRTTTCVNIADIQNDLHYHADLIAAFRDHDPDEASRLMERHIGEAMSHLANR
jgi:DNA-binding GntR family transcriptional regulator